MDELIGQLINKGDQEIIKLISELKKLKKYSFCKSHAYSYAQLVWQLAYYKAHQPQKFWRATLNHCDSSYRKWVHRHEARLVGLKLEETNLAYNCKSIYSKARNKKKWQDDKILTKEQLNQYFLEGSPFYKSLDFYPSCYLFGNCKCKKFRGIIASSRKLGYGSQVPTYIFFIGIANNQYVEVVYKGQMFIEKGVVGVTGIGELDRQYMIITAKKISCF